MPIGLGTLAALAAAGAVGQGILGYAGQRTANRTNIELARRGEKHEINMWNMANEYNTPHAQMLRMREAGLNPNLMYGQGNTGNAPGHPSPQVPTVQNEMGNLKLPDILGIMNQLAVNKKTMAEADLARYSADWQKLKMPYAKSWIDTDWQKNITEASRAVIGQNRDLLELGIRNDSYKEIMRALKGDADYKQAQGQVAQTMATFNLSVNDGIYAKLLTLLAKIIGFDPQDLIGKF